MNPTDLPPAALYLDDLHVGQRFISGHISISAEEIKAFAAQFDPQVFHLDEKLAKETFFDGLAASGWHTAAVTMRLIVSSVPIAGGVIGASVELSWPAPARPNDVLHVESEIVEIIPSRSRPDRGIVVARSETRANGDRLVQRLTSKLVVHRRPVQVSSQD